MMTVDINYADREIDILKNNGDRDLNMMTVVWKPFGIALQELPPRAWKWYLDWLGKLMWITTRIRKSFSNIKNNIFQY